MHRMNHCHQRNSSHHDTTHPANITIHTPMTSITTVNIIHQKHNRFVAELGEGGGKWITVWKDNIPLCTIRILQFSLQYNTNKEFFFY